MMPLTSAIGQSLQVAVVDNTVEAWHKHLHPPARLELRDDGGVIALVRWDAQESPLGITLEGQWRFEASGVWYWHSSKTIPTLVRTTGSEPREVARFAPSGILGWLSFPDFGKLQFQDGPILDWRYHMGWSRSGIEIVRFAFDAHGEMTCTVNSAAVGEPALSVLVTLGMYLKYRGLTDA